MDSSNIELFDVGKKSANPSIPSVPRILKVSIGRNRRYPRDSSIQVSKRSKPFKLYNLTSIPRIPKLPSFPSYSNISRIPSIPSFQSVPFSWNLATSLRRVFVLFVVSVSKNSLIFFCFL